MESSLLDGLPAVLRQPLLLSEGLVLLGQLVEGTVVAPGEPEGDYFVHGVVDLEGGGIEPIETLGFVCLSKTFVFTTT